MAQMTRAEKFWAQIFAEDLGTIEHPVKIKPEALAIIKIPANLPFAEKAEDRILVRNLKLSVTAIPAWNQQDMFLLRLLDAALRDDTLTKTQRQTVGSELLRSLASTSDGAKAIPLSILPEEWSTKSGASDTLDRLYDAGLSLLPHLPTTLGIISGRTDHKMFRDPRYQVRVAHLSRELLLGAAEWDSVTTLNALQRSLVLAGVAENHPHLINLLTVDEKMGLSIRALQGLPLDERVELVKISRARSGRSDTRMDEEKSQKLQDSIPVEKLDSLYDRGDLTPQDLRAAYVHLRRLEQYSRSEYFPRRVMAAILAAYSDNELELIDAIVQADPDTDITQVLGVL